MSTEAAKIEALEIIIKKHKEVIIERTDTIQRLREERDRLKQDVDDLQKYVPY